MTTKFLAPVNADKIFHLKKIADHWKDPKIKIIAGLIHCTYNIESTEELWKHIAKKFCLV